MLLKLQFNVQKKVKNNITQEKKKKHTIKTQVIIKKESKQILTRHFSFGKKHDFRLFKESKVSFFKSSLLIVDTGYQGLQKIHDNVLLPKQKSKKNPLTKEQKESNKLISKLRIVIENVFAKLKKFKIISEKYRNRRKRFALRLNLIASIYNLKLF